MNSNLAEKIIDAAKTSFVDSTLESNENFRARLLYNDVKKGNTVLANLENELKNCDSFWMSVAFITSSGLIVLKETLKELEKNGTKGKILTTDYLNFNDPNALKDLLKFTNIEVHVFDRENFHTKGYMFEKKEMKTFIVGSSNLTQNALKRNKEWNLKVTSLENGELVQETEDEFAQMWEDATPLSIEWIDEYSIRYEQQRQTRINEKITRIRTHILIPNKMQIEATRALDELRKKGENKALLISATGTGKTYLSAFDVRNFKPKKMLFLVHREQILKQAMKSFKDVLGNEINAGLLTGNRKDYDADYLFSTVQTMSKIDTMKIFSSDYFDYICLDETHRSAAASYQRITEYFTPKFLLGMTATPDRTDKNDIYSNFNYNIAYEIRLQQAMEMDLLCPFHYFGVSELSINGNEIEDEKDFVYLVTEERVNNVIDKAEYYGHAGRRVKGLIFCTTNQAANELSEELNKRNYRTVALSSANSQEQREEMLQRLEQDTYDEGLDYIITVDIFNEGVDIPQVNQIIMLRPTQSAIIFVQQLGRGLRKSEDKEYVVVIDFIGNYKNNFLIPIALSGDKSYNKDTLRKYIGQGNRMIPGSSTIHFDEITKKRIYESIDISNFNDIKIIRESYDRLKKRLGRIPNLKDFDEHDEIDILRVFDNKALGSYYKYLLKYDKEYEIRISEKASKYLEYICKKFASGKRVHELEMLRRLLIYDQGLMKILTSDLSEKYNIKVSEETKTNVVNIFTNKFATGAAKNTYEDCIFLEKDRDDFRISASFKEELKDKSFYNMVKEVIDFGLYRNSINYGNRYMNTNFQLYSKYTYEDVCRLLNWEKGAVALNIGGYKYDSKTKTYPVFINYDKDDNIQDTLKYEDRFINNKNLIAISKAGRSLKSEDVKIALNAEKLGVQMQLFIRKNKDDKISKEFYYLGKIKATGMTKEVIMPNTSKTAVEIKYELETPVREDIYEYIIT